MGGAGVDVGTTAVGIAVGEAEAGAAVAEMSVAVGEEISVLAIVWVGTVKGTLVGDMVAVAHAVVADIISPMVSASPFLIASPWVYASLKCDANYFMLNGLAWQ